MDLIDMSHVERMDIRPDLIIDRFNLPKFKDNFEAIRHAVDMAESDEEVAYAICGGTAHAASYPLATAIRQLGIRNYFTATDEITNRQDVWCQAYNMASKEKEALPHDGSHSATGMMMVVLNNCNRYIDGKGKWHEAESLEAFFKTEGYLLN